MLRRRASAALTVTYHGTKSAALLHLTAIRFPFLSHVTGGRREDGSQNQSSLNTRLSARLATFHAQLPRKDAHHSPSSGDGGIGSHARATATPHTTGQCVTQALTEHVQTTTLPHVKPFSFSFHKHIQQQSSRTVSSSSPYHRTTTNLSHAATPYREELSSPPPASYNTLLYANHVKPGAGSAFPLRSAPSHAECVDEVRSGIYLYTNDADDLGFHLPPRTLLTDAATQNFSSQANRSLAPQASPGEPAQDASQHVSTPVDPAKLAAHEVPTSFCFGQPVPRYALSPVIHTFGAQWQWRPVRLVWRPRPDLASTPAQLAAAWERYKNERSASPSGLKDGETLQEEGAGPAFPEDSIVWCAEQRLRSLSEGTPRLCMVPFMLCPLRAVLPFSDVGDDDSGGNEKNLGGAVHPQCPPQPPLDTLSHLEWRRALTTLPHLDEDVLSHILVALLADNSVFASAPPPMIGDRITSISTTSPTAEKPPRLSLESARLLAEFLRPHVAFSIPSPLGDMTAVMGHQNPWVVTETPHNGADRTRKPQRHRPHQSHMHKAYDDGGGSVRQASLAHMLASRERWVEQLFQMAVGPTPGRGPEPRRAPPPSQAADGHSLARQTPERHREPSGLTSGSSSASDRRSVVETPQDASRHVQVFPTPRVLNSGAKATPHQDPPQTPEATGPPADAGQPNASPSPRQRLASLLFPPESVTTVELPISAPTPSSRCQDLAMRSTAPSLPPAYCNVLLGPLAELAVALDHYAALVARKELSFSAACFAVLTDTKHAAAVQRLAHGSEEREGQGRVASLSRRTGGARARAPLARHRRARVLAPSTVAGVAAVERELTAAVVAHEALQEAALRRNKTLVGKSSETTVGLSGFRD